MRNDERHEPHNEKRKIENGSNFFRIYIYIVRLSQVHFLYDTEWTDEWP